MAQLSQEDQARLDEINAELARRDAAVAAQQPAPPASLQPPTSTSPAAAAAKTSLSAEDQARLDEINAELARRGDTTAAPAVADPMAAAAVPTAGASVAPGVTALVQTGAGIKSAVYPTTAREGVNEKYEKLPDWLGMPELHQVSINSAKAIFGTMTSDPEQTEKILRKQFPSMTIRKDGRYILMNSADGQTYAFKPGLRASDLARAGAAMAATVPASLLAPEIAGAGVLGGALAGAAGSATLEGLKALAGGDFSGKQVALGGFLGGLVPAAASALGVPADSAAAAAAGAAPQPPPLAPGAVGDMAAPAAAAADPQALKTLAGQMAAAARDPEGPAAAALSQQVKADPSVIAAAQRMGVLQHLQPDHVSTNDPFQMLSQAYKAAPGGAVAKQAEADAIEAIGASMKRTLTTLGGESDLSVLDHTVKTSFEQNLADAKAVADSLYSRADEAIPKSAPTPATKTLAAIDEIAANRNGTLPKPLQKLRAALAPRDGVEPTWDITNATKKQLGAATVGRGPYKDLEPGLAKQLFPALDADRMAVARAHGADNTLGAADLAFKGLQSFEDRAVDALGAQGAKSLAGLELKSDLLPKLKGSTSMLARGNVDPFVKQITSIPEELRSKFAASTVMSTFLDPNKTNLEGFVNWFGAVKANERSYNALMTYLPTAAREGLQDAYTVARGVVGAMSKRVPAASAVFPATAAPNGVALKLFGLVADNTAGRALNMAGVPSPAGGFTNFLLAKISGADTPITEALANFFTSPAGRATMNATNAATWSPRMVAGIAASVPFKKVMAAVGMSPADGQKWLESATGTTVKETR